MKYQHKPTVVEAEQFDGKNNPFGLVKIHECPGKCNLCYSANGIVYEHRNIRIMPGDYLVRFNEHLFTVWPKEKFEKEYEVVKPEGYLYTTIDNVPLFMGGQYFYLENGEIKERTIRAMFEVAGFPIFGSREGAQRWLDSHKGHPEAKGRTVEGGPYVTLEDGSKIRYKDWEWGEPMKGPDPFGRENR